MWSISCVTCRRRPSDGWFDSGCEHAKRRVRRLGRATRHAGPLSDCQSPAVNDASTLRLFVENGAYWCWSAGNTTSVAVFWPAAWSWSCAAYTDTSSVLHEFIWRESGSAICRHVDTDRSSYTTTDPWRSRCPCLELSALRRHWLPFDISWRQCCSWHPLLIPEPRHRQHVTVCCLLGGPATFFVTLPPEHRRC